MILYIYIYIYTIIDDTLQVEHHSKNPVIWCICNMEDFFEATYKIPDVYVRENILYKNFCVSEMLYLVLAAIHVGNGSYAAKDC